MRCAQLTALNVTCMDIQQYGGSVGRCVYRQDDAFYPSCCRRFGSPRHWTQREALMWYLQTARGAVVRPSYSVTVTVRLCTIVAITCGDCTSTLTSCDCTSTLTYTDCTSTLTCSDCTSTLTCNDCTSTRKCSDCTSTLTCSYCTSPLTCTDCTSPLTCRNCTSH